MKKTLFIGPLPPPITGQAMAFSYLRVLQKKHKNLTIFDTEKYKIQVFNYLNSAIALPFLILFSNVKMVYFIGSRSKPGFLRQLPFLTVSILKKIRIVNHLHGADFKHFYRNSGKFKSVVHWVYSRINLSLVLLDQMKDQFESFPKMKLEVVPNAVGSDFENLELKFPKQKKVLYFSNIMASKGIVEFLNASKTVLANDGEVVIDIAGSFYGDHIYSKNEIKTIFLTKFEALKSNYPNRIFYHGTVTGQKKVDLLKQASIFILPTYYPTEAFPISILEAMAAGNAIITTSHNYLKYIVAKESGILIPIQDENEIALNIERLFQDNKGLLGFQKNNYLLAKKFTIDPYLKSIEEIL